MERKMACRALGFWPKDLADLIASYSDWTLNEKVSHLTGKWMIREDDNMRVVLNSPYFEIAWYRSCSLLKIRSIHLDGFDRILARSIDGLCDAIASRDWDWTGKGRMPMSESEIVILDEWLGTVK